MHGMAQHALRAVAVTSSDESRLVDKCRDIQSNSCNNRGK